LAIANITVDGRIPKSFIDVQFQQIIGTSGLGTNLYDNLVFILKQDNESDVVLRIDAVRYIVSQNKNIVKTSVSGRDGTVKEYNSDGDFMIRGTASLTNKDSRLFPEDPLQTFLRIAKAKTEIEVLSKILNEFFKIDSVIMEEYDTSPQTGATAVNIQFVLSSETPFDVKEFELT